MAGSASMVASSNPPGFRAGAAAALRGLRLALRDPQVRRSYARIVVALLAITLALDAGGIAGLVAATGWGDDTSSWLVVALVVARVVGTLAILLVAPVLAIFVLNLVLPLFNEGPFLAGVQALDPARARALAEGPHLSIRRQIQISLLRLLLFVSLSLAAFVVSFVPVVGQIAGPALATYFAARALAWELLDPYFALTDRAWDRQVAYLGQHQAAVVGFGLPFALIFAVPLLGPLVFVLAQASAAVLVCEVLEPPPHPPHAPA